MSATQPRSEEQYKIFIYDLCFSNYQRWQTNNRELTLDIPCPVISMLMFGQAESLLKVLEF